MRPTSRYAPLFAAVLLILASLPSSSLLFAHSHSSQADSKPHGRVMLLPKYSSGQVFHYQIDMRNSSKGRTGGVVEDPEAATQLKQSTTVLIRLDVLGPTAGATPSPSAATPAAPTAASASATKEKAAARGTRMKVTYEQSDATLDSDAYDEQAEALVAQYRNLNGKSLEFTMDPDGHVAHLAGLDKILQDPSAAASAQSWMSNISPTGIPKHGISVGEKWNSVEKLPGSPLRGTIWSAESTYVRDEPCSLGSSQHPGISPASDKSASTTSPSAAVTPAPTPPPEEDTCAVVVTHFKILQSEQRDDLTPVAFARAGMKTSGSWTGDGESLSSISLRTGFVVSVSQNAKQQMDFVISSRSSNVSLTYTGEVSSQTEIQLLDSTP
jgi:hypothetical protein